MIYLLGEIVRIEAITPTQDGNYVGFSYEFIFDPTQQQINYLTACACIRSMNPELLSGEMILDNGEYVYPILIMLEELDQMVAFSLWGAGHRDDIYQVYYARFQ
jgi:hypothetical protein